MTVLERLMSHVLPEPMSGCWLWMGHIKHGRQAKDRDTSQQSDGYGRIMVDGKVRPAHQVAYEQFKGPIPKGLVPDHKCRVHCCINPDHLEPVTNLENVRRGNAGKLQKARTHCKQGHPFDAENTVVRNGKRACRECGRRWALALYHRKKSK